MRNFGDMSGKIAAVGSLVRSTVPELLSSALSELLQRHTDLPATFFAPGRMLSLLTFLTIARS